VNLGGTELVLALQTRDMVNTHLIVDVLHPQQGAMIRIEAPEPKDPLCVHEARMLRAALGKME
jgi:hypothetical protein